MKDVLDGLQESDGVPTYYVHRKKIMFQGTQSNGPSYGLLRSLALRIIIGSGYSNNMNRRKNQTET